MAGGFLGQVQRGRARGVRGVRCGRAAAAVWVGLLMAAGMAGAQQAPSPASPPARTPPATPAQAQPSPAAVKAGETQTPADAGLSTTVWEWKGLRVDKILFQGVTFDAADTLPKELPQKEGMPLDPQLVRASLRRLFVSGRYRDVSVRGVRQGDAVTLVFTGVARYYVGRVTIDGVKNDLWPRCWSLRRSFRRERRSTNRRLQPGRRESRRCCSSRGTTSRSCRRTRRSMLRAIR